ncbi:MAG: Smr/MutS family protein [Candidatus Accumulibacter sp.]|nr:Smr/MutS family protein [Accumulibacter sp.]
MTRAKRPPVNEKPTPDEIADFHRAIQGTRPLRAPDRVVPERPKPSPRPRRREPDTEPAVESVGDPPGIDRAPSDSGNFLRVGLHRNTLRDLKRGRWIIQNHIDLHGLNRSDALDAVASFIAESIAAGKRCVRIVHGRGKGSPGGYGVLRGLVQSWLAQQANVLAFCSAPPSDGGDGAVWVLLKSGRTAAARRTV